MSSLNPEPPDVSASEHMVPNPEPPHMSPSEHLVLNPELNKTLMPTILQRLHKGGIQLSLRIDERVNHR